MLTSQPDADAARNSFFANLHGAGTETFESFATGTAAPLSVNFVGAGTATLTGNIESGSIGFGRYPISGTKYFNTNGMFGLTLPTRSRLMAFYGIDMAISAHRWSRR